MENFYGENGTDGRREAVAVDWNDPSQQMMAKEEVDEDEQLSFEQIRGVPRDALLVILRWLVSASGKRSRWDQAKVRLALLCHLCNLDGLGSISYEKLAVELGVTRSLLSLRSLQIIDGFQIEKTRNGKPRRTRETYRQSATEAHRRAGHRMSEDSVKDI